MSSSHDSNRQVEGASSHRLGDRWRQASRGDEYIVTRVGKRKLTMVCRRPNFDITVTAWIDRLASDPDWEPIANVWAVAE